MTTSSSGETREVDWEGLAAFANALETAAEELGIGEYWTRPYRQPVSAAEGAPPCDIIVHDWRIYQNPEVEICGICGAIRRSRPS